MTARLSLLEEMLSDRLEPPETEHVIQLFYISNVFILIYLLKSVTSRRSVVLICRLTQYYEILKYSRVCFHSNVIIDLLVIIRENYLYKTVRTGFLHEAEISDTITHPNSAISPDEN